MTGIQLYLPVAGLSVDVLTIMLAGASVGFLSGLFGVGGGFLITPLLMFIGIPSSIAIATGANQSVATSAGGALSHWRRGNVDVKMALTLMSSGVVGSLVGIQLVKFLKQVGQFDVVVSLTYVVLLGVVGTLMLIESVNAMRTSAKTGVRSERHAGQHLAIHRLPFKTRFPRSKRYISIIPPLAIGGFVGVLSAIMGIGGGFILVPAMVYLLKMRTIHAVGTSLFQIVFVSGFTTFLHATTLNTVDVVLAMLLIVGGVVGSELGLKAGRALNGEQLRALLALLVLAVCARVAFDLVVTPAEIFTLR